MMDFYVVLVEVLLTLLEALNLSTVVTRKVGTYLLVFKLQR